MKGKIQLSLEKKRTSLDSLPPWNIRHTNSRNWVRVRKKKRKKKEEEKVEEEDGKKK